MRNLKFYILFLLALLNLNVYSQKTIKDIDFEIGNIDSLIENGEFREALLLADSVEKYSNILSYKLGIAESNRCKGEVYSQRDNFKFSLDNFKQALYIYTDLKIENKIASVLLSIGNLYSEINEENIALGYYFRAEKIGLKINKQDIVATAYNNIANRYQNMNQFFQSNVYLKKSLAISFMINDSTSIARVYHNIGVNFELENKSDSALVYFNKSLLYLISSNENIGHVYNYLEIGNTLVKQNKLIDAEINILKALEICKRKDIVGMFNDVYDGLYHLYEQKKDYEKAYLYQSLYLLGNSFDKKEGDKKELLKKEIEDEYKKQREIQNKISEQKQMFAKTQIQNQKKLITYSIIALMILSGLIIFAFRSNYYRRKAYSIISLRKEIVDFKQKEMLDSINYAKYIQNAILPNEELIKKLNTFVLFKPKDIVSGDFYWHHQNNFPLNVDENCTYFAVADCTGHGVPGALVSVIGNNGLNSCVKEFKITDTNLILDKLSEIVENTFEKSHNQLKDGMDISIVRLLKKENSNTVNVQWSGANNPIWIINKAGDFTEIKANKQPIGSFEDKVPFTKHEFDLEKGDRIYLFTDGYADQFGGEKEKKYRYKQLSDFLISTINMSMNDQKNELDKNFNEWKGDLDQVDDVCILGITV